jgi:hypothetical protein
LPSMVLESQPGITLAGTAAMCQVCYKQVHSLTHSHSLTLGHTRAHPHTHSQSHARSQSHAHTHTHSQSHARSQSHAHTHTHPVMSHSLTLSLSRSRSYTHTHTHTQHAYLSISISFYFFSLSLPYVDCIDCVQLRSTTGRFRRRTKVPPTGGPQLSTASLRVGHRHRCGR